MLMVAAAILAGVSIAAAFAFRSEIRKLRGQRQIGDADRRERLLTDRED